MDGAIQRSKSCHNDAMATRDWNKTDFCNAFDDAGLYLDLRARRQSATPQPDAQLSYFDLTANKSTQTAAYMMLSNASSGFADRVDHIQKLVEPSVQAIVQSHFFGDQTSTGAGAGARADLGSSALGGNQAAAGGIDRN